MKILVINCGSSSLKYQLIDMAGESVLCKGLCERIGIEGSNITHKANGGEWSVQTPFPTHTDVYKRQIYVNQNFLFLRKFFILWLFFVHIVSIIWKSIQNPPHLSSIFINNLACIYAL